MAADDDLCQVCEVCDNTGRLLGDACPLCGDAHVDEAEETSSASTSDSEDVDEDDDNCITDYDEEELTLLPPAVSRWSRGSRVGYDRYGNNTFNFARVTAVNPDGSYNVVCSDGLHHTDIANSQLRSPVRKTKNLPLSVKTNATFPPPGLARSRGTSASARSNSDVTASGDDSDASCEDWSPVFQAPAPSFHWEVEPLDAEAANAEGFSLLPESGLGLRGLCTRPASCTEDGAPKLGGPILDLLKSLA